MSFGVILKFWSTEKSQKIQSSDEILMWLIKNFDQLTKNEFDQTPKLLENFDQLKMSSEIWSSDRFPFFNPDIIYKYFWNIEFWFWFKFKFFFKVT